VGNRSTVTLPSGVVTTYLYDSLNRLTNLTHTVSSTLKASYSYKLDATGRRTNAVEILGDEYAGYMTNNLSWQFDGMYRLTNEVSVTTSTNAPYAYTNSYVYDIEGNRLHKIRTGSGAETIDYGYDANDQLLRETNSAVITTYLYDANGSMTNRAIGTTNYNYAYDLKNKLSVLGTNGTSLASYEYNDQGIRVRSTSGGNTSYYLIDANNHTGYQQILEESATLRGSPTTSYVLGDDVLAQTVGSTVSYLLYDGHGSTRQVSGSAGNVTSRYNYDAYGITQATTTTSGVETSILYCGQQYDSTLNMYNSRARYYNPANGRFNQRDSFASNSEDPQSLHKYAYCNGDPVNGIDPSGQFTLVELVVVIATVFVLTAMLAPGLNKGKQKAQYTMANLSGADDVANAIKAANIDINESRIQLGEDMHQTFLESLKKQGEYRRQFERARAGNEIVAADANAWLHEGSGYALGAVGFPEMEWDLFANAPSGFSNFRLARQTHDAFEETLNSLYGTIKGDWEMRTAPGLRGIDATFKGDMSRFPGFKYGELKPYSQSTLRRFGEQLDRWKLPNGETELFFYNQGGAIGSSGLRF
jgi:RHS repeat-associated protein